MRRYKYYCEEKFDLYKDVPTIKKQEKRYSKLEVYRKKRDIGEKKFDVFLEASKKAESINIFGV